jgi:hypothetical protein
LGSITHLYTNKGGNSLSLAPFFVILLFFFSSCQLGGIFPLFHGMMIKGKERKKRRKEDDSWKESKDKSRKKKKEKRKKKLELVSSTICLVLACLLLRLLHI